METKETGVDMSLLNASIDQLIQWQGEIVGELADRAQKAENAKRASAPWEHGHFRVDDPAAKIALLEARLAAAERHRVPPIVDTRPSAFQTIAQAPGMLGGRPRPGTVLVTERTDPKAAAIFAGIAPRADGIAGLHGNGRGEGLIDF